MAFDLKYLARVSTSANTEGLQVWTYNGSATGSNDDIATITAASYFDDALSNPVTGTGPFKLGDVMHIHGNDTENMFSVSALAGGMTVAAYNEGGGGGGDVVLPTVANYISHFTNTAGEISSDPANVINAGNIQAGLDGTAGFFQSFPTNSAAGSLAMVAVSNLTGDFDTFIINDSGTAQSQNITIPDSGEANSKFILADSAAATQTINSSLQMQGNVQAGASGFAAEVRSFPPTAAKGSLRFEAADNVGDFSLFITNKAQTKDIVSFIPVCDSSAPDFIMTSPASAQTIDKGITALGPVTSGASGTQGGLTLFPPTAASGSLVLSATDNAAGNFQTIIGTAASVGQVQLLTLPDTSQFSSTFMLTALATPSLGANLITFDMEIAFDDISGGISVVIMPGLTSASYIIRDIYMGPSSSDLSGGDRDMVIDDGTTDYAVIPSASLLTAANARWGSAAIPYPASERLMFKTAAGADLELHLTGGTADYTAGSVYISVVAERVA